MTISEKVESIDHAITVSELSALLHLGKTAIYDMARRAALPHYRISGSLRFDPQTIAEWLREHTIENPLRRKRK
ncbi:MAG: helix-turn-helix domain-containing protein [Terracidiphilus sp.]|jgi:excisionase family DNA binding protein